MNKFKLFVENFIIYGFGGIINKIIPLIMVPIIAKIMPNSTYFGISDMSNTILTFASSLAVMGMYDAMYRMFFDREDEKYKKEVCSTAFIFTSITSIIVFFCLVIFRNNVAELFMGSSEYANIIYITAIATLIGATNSIIAAPTRMQNKRKVFLIVNTVSPILSYSISIPLLLKGYYLIALPLAGAVATLVIEITFLVLNKSWFGFKYFNKDILKQLLIIGIPLLPNFIVYWLFNSSDKIMITNILGMGETGIYTIGSKLGHASQLIYTAFASGWQFFAFSTMKDNDQVRYNSSIFEYLGIISFCATSMICCISYYLYDFLFEIEYIQGYIVAPYLFLAPLLQMLFQISSNQFLIIKKTWPIIFILSIGAGSNILLNLLLIPSLGIEGAAIATLIGYSISVIICSLVLIKMRLMIISNRFILSSIIMILFFVAWRFWGKTNILICLLFLISIFSMFMILYRTEIRGLVVKFKAILTNKS